MKISDLIITQEELRHPDKIRPILERFQIGDIIKSGKPIIINEVDGKLYVTDGHHRCVAAVYAGVDLLQDEYIIKHYSVAEFEEFNPRNEWYTPFNPRTEVRLGDFGRYIEFAKNPENHPTILDNLHTLCIRFKKPRNLTTFEQLAIKYGYPDYLP